MRVWSPHNASKNRSPLLFLTVLDRGEQAATALESNLTSLERRLDDMLAAFEAAAATRQAKPDEPGDKGEAKD
jgi:hypothetical protein